MIKEHLFMLSCLKAYLENEKINKDCDIDLEKLYIISKAHNLSAIVFSVIKDNDSIKGQKEAYKSFENDFFDAVVRFDFQDKVQKEIDDILSNEKIRHIFFKGSEIKNYFPTPELRSMGDIDVLIDSENRDKVKSILSKNGFDIIDQNGPVYSYKKDDVLLEVHTKIVSGKIGNKDAENYFSDAIEHSVVKDFSGTLKPNYHFEYLIVHIAHHFWFYGAGAKMILDLAVMQKHFDIDLDKVVTDLENIKLDNFAKIIISICYKWFHIGKSYNIDTNKTEEFLLTFGAFGNFNRDKGAVIRRKALEEGNNTAFGAKLALAFPSYSKMKNIPYMRFIEGRPYLLPFGWVYRGIYNIKNRKDFLKETTSALGSDETKAKAEIELKYFEEIGLL